MHPTTRQFRIWSLWTDQSIDTGMIVSAPSDERALELATMRGAGWGCGRDPRYLGCHAQEVCEPSATSHV